jgi:hypothetical protein
MVVLYIVESVLFYIFLPVDAIAWHLHGSGFCRRTRQLDLSLNRPDWQGTRKID